MLLLVEMDETWRLYTPTEFYDKQTISLWNTGKKLLPGYLLGILLLNVLTVFTRNAKYHGSCWV